MIFILFWFSILGALLIRMNDFSSGYEIRNLSIIICEIIPFEHTSVVMCFLKRLDDFQYYAHGSETLRFQSFKALRSEHNVSFQATI